MAPVDSGASKTILLSSSISGIQQGLLLFPSGSVGKLYIPSGLAFGVSPVLGTGIQPNSNLLYEIKLDTVKSSKLPADLAAIDDYIKSNSIIPKKDPISGIRYVINDSTETSQVVPTDSVQISWKVKILNGDSLVTISPKTILLKDQIVSKAQIAGLRIMLPKFHEGNSVTLYIPSGYAYGSNTQKILSIPPNSNLIYWIKLLKVY